MPKEHIQQHVLRPTNESIFIIQGAHPFNGEILVLLNALY